MKSRKTRMLVALGLVAIGGFSVIAVSLAESIKTIIPDPSNARQTIPTIHFRSDIGDSDKYVELKNDRSLVRIDTTGYNFVLKKGDSRASGVSSTILGGEMNYVTDSNYATIMAGNNNQISNSSGAIIGGGDHNVITGNYGTIAGGRGNKVGKVDYSTVVGGKDNEANGDYAVSLGNTSKANGENSVAMGENATVKGANSFLWNDGASSQTLTKENTFAVVGKSGMVVNATSAHRFAQLTIGGSLIINSRTNDASVCNGATKGVVKVVNGSHGQACFCSCNGSKRNSLYGGGDCSSKCDTAVTPKCDNNYLIKDCTTTPYSYSGHCLDGRGEVVEGDGAYMIDKNGKVHWTCQTNDGKTDHCVGDVTSIIGGTCTEPAGEYKCTGEFEHALPGSNCGGEGLTDNEGVKLYPSQAEANSHKCGWYCEPGYQIKGDICAPYDGCDERDEGDYHIPYLAHDQTKTITNNAGTCTKQVTCTNGISTLGAGESCYSCTGPQPGTNTKRGGTSPSGGNKAWEYVENTSATLGACQWTCQDNTFEQVGDSTDCAKINYTCGLTLNSCGGGVTPTGTGPAVDGEYDWYCGTRECGMCEDGTALDSASLHSGKCKTENSIRVRFNVINNNSSIWLDEVVFDEFPACNYSRPQGEITDVINLSQGESVMGDYYSCPSFTVGQKYTAKLKARPDYLNSPTMTYATSDFYLNNGDNTVTLNVDKMSLTYYITPSATIRNGAGEVDLDVTVNGNYTNLPSDLGLEIYLYGYDGSSPVNESFMAPGSVTPVPVGKYQGFVGYTTLSWVTPQFIVYDFGFDSSYSKQTTINGDTYIMNRTPSSVPQCGSANGKNRDSAPSTTEEKCENGTPSAISQGDLTWTWTCSKNGMTTNPSCIAYNYPKCGSASGSVVPSMPEGAAACSVGYRVQPISTGASQFTWECGNGGPVTAKCSATREQTIHIACHITKEKDSYAPNGCGGPVWKETRYSLVGDITEAPVQINIIEKMKHKRLTGQPSSCNYLDIVTDNFDYIIYEGESEAELNRGATNDTLWEDGTGYSRYYIHDSNDVIANCGEGCSVVIDECTESVVEVGTPSYSCTGQQPGTNTRRGGTSPSGGNKAWEYVENTSASLEACQWTCQDNTFEPVEDSTDCTKINYTCGLTLNSCGGGVTPTGTGPAVDGEYDWYCGTLECGMCADGTVPETLHNGACVNSCEDYTLSTCPTGGSCSSCPSDSSKKKLDSCNCGYYKDGNSCTKCSAGEYSSTGSTSCSTADIGYYANGGCSQTACTNRPENSHYTSNASSNTCSWQCNTFYLPEGNSCKEPIRWKWDFFNGCRIDVDPSDGYSCCDEYGDCSSCYSRKTSRSETATSANHKKSQRPVFYSAFLSDSEISYHQRTTDVFDVDGLLPPNWDFYSETSGYVNFAPFSTEDVGDYGTKITVNLSNFISSSYDRCKTNDCILYSSCNGVSPLAGSSIKYYTRAFARERIESVFSEWPCNYYAQAAYWGGSKKIYQGMIYAKDYYNSSKGMRGALYADTYGNEHYICALSVPVYKNKSGQSGGGGGGGGGCFLPGTPVITSEGYKNIENIEVGDKVLSYSEDTKTFEYNTVNTKWIFEDNTDDVYELVMGDDVLQVTALHRFFVVRANSDEYQCKKSYLWDVAKRLQVGDQLMMSDGSYVTIDEISHHEHSGTVYNLGVDNVHNFFVGEGYLVHNIQSIEQKVLFGDYTWDGGTDCGRHWLIDDMGATAGWYNPCNGDYIIY